MRLERRFGYETERRLQLTRADSALSELVWFTVRNYVVPVIQMKLLWIESEAFGQQARTLPLRMAVVSVS
jgi:hypothetical protein